MEKQTSKIQLDFVDLLKAIAIYFVLIYHFPSKSIDFLKNSNWESYVSYYLSAAFSTCVPIFFFVNGGLLLNKNSVDIRKHSYKTIKIILLTLIWGLITLVCLSWIRNESLSLTELFTGLYQLKQGWINHLWFFEALVVIYIFFPIIYTTYKTSPGNFYFFLICVFTLTFFNKFLGNVAYLLGSIVPALNNKKLIDLNYFSGFNAFMGIHGFSIGYFLLGGLIFPYRKQVDKKIRTTALIILPTSLLLLFLYGVRTSKNLGFIWDLVWNGYDSIFTLINVLAIFILSLNYEHKGIVGQLIKAVGQNSLGIYLIHLIIGPILLKFFIIQGIFGNIVFSTTILIVSLALSLFIKRLPILKNLLSMG